MTNELADLKEKWAQKTFKASPKEHITKGICINCKEPALPKCYSNAGRKEFKISALCELCFDEIVGLPPEENEDYFSEDDNEPAF